MKVFLVFILFIISISLKAQYPITQNLGNTTTRVQVPANGAMNANFINRPFSDTTSANLTNVKYYSGAQIYTTTDSIFWIRNAIATRWLSIGGGSAGGGGGGSQTWQQTMITGSTILQNNLITGGGFKFVYNGLDSFHLRGNNISPDPTVFALDDALFIYRQPSDAQIRITAAPNFTLNISGGVGTGVGSGYGIAFNPSASSANGGTMRLSHSNTNYIHQSFFNDGGGEMGRIGISSNEFYLRGLTDSTALTLRARKPASVEIDDSRFTLSYGADTASAGNLALPYSGNAFNITGATTINAIYTYAWQAGSIVYLKFNSALTVNDNTAGAAGTAPIQLSGNTSFSASAGDLLAILYNGTDWTEIGRSYASVVNGALFARQDARNNTGSAGYFSHAGLGWNQDSVSSYSINGASGGITNNIYLNAGGDAYLNTNSSTTYHEAGTQSLYSFLNSYDVNISQYFSAIRVTKDSIRLMPHQKRLNIDSLGAGVSTDSVMVWNSQTGRVGYRNTSSFGTTYTASNGLTLSGSDFKLGGTLSDATTTLAAGANSLLLTGNTATSNSIFSITSTSTALASGNEALNIAMSGVNGTNAITATGLVISVTNTNATSGTNVGLNVTASGATTLNRSILATGAALFVTGGDSEHYLMAQNASPAAGNNNVKLWYSSNFVLMDANHGVGGSFTIRNNGAGPLQLSAASSQEVQLRPNASTTATFSGTTAIITTPTSIVTGSAPTARLHIATGTAAEATAPIKITTASAALMTGSEAGAIEVLVDSIYYTGSDATRRRLAYVKEIGSFQFDKGANVAAANDLTLGQDGNLFTITGATQINAITTQNWQSGSTISFIFTGAPLVKNNTAGAVGTATMLLSGRTDFQAAAGDYIKFQYDGTNWYETNRIVAATVGSNTYSELLTQSGNSVTWGGTATTDRTATLGANTVLFTANTLAGDPALSITSNSTAASGGLQKGFNVELSGINSNAGQLTYGVYSSNIHTGGTSTNYGGYFNASGGSVNYGVWGESTQVGVNGNGATGILGTGTSFAVRGVASSSGVGGNFNSVDGNAINGIRIAASTNSVLTVMQVDRSTTGTAANGIGGGIDLYTETDNGTGIIANQIQWSLTTAANATYTSQLKITGANSGALNDIITFEGNKRTMLYGRFEPQQGADVASAVGAIAVGLDGNTFELTGTSAITLISNLNWVNGSQITFVFTSTASLTDGTANSGTDIGMELAGNANFTGSADDVITLVLSEIGGTQRWREKSRSVN